MQLDNMVIGIGAIVLVVLVVLWFFLPFAVFGTQPKLDKLLEEIKRANDLLFEMNANIRRLTQESSGQVATETLITCQDCHKQHSGSVPACPFCGCRRR